MAAISVLSMDAGLLWTALGSVAGVLGVVLVGWQVRLQISDRRRSERPHSAQSVNSRSIGLPVAVPLGRLPDHIWGRTVVLAQLRHQLTRWRWHRGRTWVLAGMGGVSKSTVALETA